MRHWGSRPADPLTGLRPPAVDWTRRRSEHQSWKAVAFVQWNEIGLHLLLEFDTLGGQSRSYVHCGRKSEVLLQRRRFVEGTVLAGISLGVNASFMGRGLPIPWAEENSS